MKLALQDLPRAGLEFDHVLRIPELELVGEERAEVRDARIRGSVRPGSWGIEFRARLEARVELACSRCLEPGQVPIALDFELILVPEGAEPDEDGAASPDEDAPDAELFFPIAEERADLVAIAREQIYLNLPLKPVCAPSCRGLCPTCGVNRNRIECACPGEPLDPRLAPLLQFRKRPGGP